MHRGTIDVDSELIQYYSDKDALKQADMPTMNLEASIKRTVDLRIEKEEDKRSKGSSVMFLKDKLMYQGNEEKILSQMNEQNNDPNLDNSKGRGSIIED